MSETTQAPTPNRIRIHTLLSQLMDRAGVAPTQEFHHGLEQRAIANVWQTEEASFACYHDMDPAVDATAVFEVRLGPPPAARAEEVLMQLLDANFRVSGHGPGCFAVDSTSGDVILSLAVPIAALDTYLKFEQGVQFLEDMKREWDDGVVGDLHRESGVTSLATFA